MATFIKKIGSFRYLQQVARKNWKCSCCEKKILMNNNHVVVWLGTSINKRYRLDCFNGMEK